MIKAARALVDFYHNSIQVTCFEHFEMEKNTPVWVLFPIFELFNVDFPNVTAKQSVICFAYGI